MKEKISMKAYPVGFKLYLIYFTITMSVESYFFKGWKTTKKILSIPVKTSHGYINIELFLYMIEK